MIQLNNLDRQTGNAREELEGAFKRGAVWRFGFFRLPDSRRRVLMKVANV